MDRIHGTAHYDKRRAFETEAAAKLAADVSAGDAAHALSTLQAAPKPGKYLRSAVTGGLAVPAVKAVGRALEAAVDAKSGHGGAALRALTDVTRGGLVRSMGEGALGASAVRAIADGIETNKARKILRQFSHQEQRKLSALAPPKALTSAVSSAASRGSNVGRFSGMTTTNALKSPGSVLSGVVDPRRSIKASVAIPH